MSLQTRLSALITAIGADVKDLLARVTELESPTPLDAGGPTTSPTETVDAGTII